MYEGEWKEDKQDGKGIEYYENGKKNMKEIVKKIDEKVNEY